MTADFCQKIKVKLIIAQIVEHFLFTILLTVAIFYAKQMIDEYSEGKTSFSISSKPLTAKDMPTITICFKSIKNLNYGVDIIVQALTQNPESPLAMGQNEAKGQTIYLQKMILAEGTYANWYTDCFSLDFDISQEFYENNISNSFVWDRFFHLELISINLTKDSTNIVSEIQMYVTSKENSYGAIIYQWFDGHVDPLKLKRNSFNLVQIEKIRRYQYISSTCSHNSFFECVSSEISNLQKCFQNGQTCSPFSLPLEFQPLSLPSEVVACTNNASQCWEKIVEHAFPICMSRKSCEVQEYHAKLQSILDLKSDRFGVEQQMVYNWGVNESLVRKILDNTDKAILFSLSLDELDWSKGDRTKELEVEVFKEYYIWDELSLVGKVGGLMGLLIGFSFISCFRWMKTQTLGIVP